MNKKAVIALVLIVLALLFGYFFLTKNSKTNGPLNSGTSSGSKSIKDLLTSGVAQKCTFSTTSDSGKSEGTTYVSKDKVRSDFMVTTSGKGMGSHMIVDGNTSYMWTDGEKTGYKMSFDPSTTTASTEPVSADYSKGDVSSDSKMDYNCSAWVVDASVFKTPSDVNFMEFNIPTAPPQGSGSSSQCSYCDSLTGDSKAQCMTALGCK